MLEHNQLRLLKLQKEHGLEAGLKIFLSDRILASWHIDDVKACYPNFTDSQCMVVLTWIQGYIEAGVGISNEVIAEVTGRVGKERGWDLTPGEDENDYTEDWDDDSLRMANPPTI